MNSPTAYLFKLEAGASRNPKIPFKNVAVENGIVVGFVQVELYQLLYQEDQVNVLGLAVRKDKQKKGYGKRLMQHVEEWARNMNCGAVRLNSAIQRCDSHEFYRALGYENTKAQKRFVKYI